MRKAFCIGGPLDGRWHKRDPKADTLTAYFFESFKPLGPNDPVQYPFENLKTCEYGYRKFSPGVAFWLTKDFINNPLKLLEHLMKNYKPGKI